VPFELILPTTAAFARCGFPRGVKSWPVQAAHRRWRKTKEAAFRVAHQPFVKSGTATLELALAGVPMVAAYKAGAVETWIMRSLIQLNSVILANLVIGENVVPEFIQQDCTPAKLAPALREVLIDSALRRRQLEAFAKIDAINVDRRPAAERARGRYRAGNAAQVAAVQVSVVLLALDDIDVVAAGDAGIKLPRAADLLLRILDHFVSTG